VVEAVGILADMNVKAVSLADTVGVADAAKISSVVSAVIKRFDFVEIGVHLHSRPQHAAEKVLAAYDAGCRRFDSALGGLGGCPFAQDEMVGNIPTERVLEALSQRGVPPPIRRPLDSVLNFSAEIGAKYKK
jgi:hydroxymethylglutaryl-CoA lyase